MGGYVVGAHRCEQQSEHRKHADLEQHLKPHRHPESPQWRNVRQRPFEPPSCELSVPTVAHQREPQHQGLSQRRRRRCPTRSRHSPLEEHDEQVVETDVDHVGNQRSAHRGGRITAAVACFAQRDGKQKHRSPEDACIHIGRGLSPRRRARGDPGDLGRDPKPDDGRDCSEHRCEEQTSGEKAGDALAVASANRLRHAHLHCADQPKAEAQQGEAEDSADAHAGERVRPESADE